MMRDRFPVRQMIVVGCLPSLLKVLFYRSRGAKIGTGVSIGLGSVIIADEIEIGEGVQIGFGSYLRARKIKIGDYARIGSTTFIDVETIEIGEDAKINEQVFVGGLSSPHSHFHLGARTIIMQHTFINVARPVTIGDDTGIGGKCTIFTHGSWQNMLEGYPVTFAPVTIGNNVWIPWQVFIMPGVTIGDGATIGAGALVVKDIPAGSLAVGSPAKVIRTSDQYPVALDMDKKKQMLRNMLAEFLEYLEYEKYQVDYDANSEFDTVAVIDSVGRNSNIIVSYVDFGQNLEKIRPESAVVLSLSRIPEEYRQAIKNKKSLWVDLEAVERGGVSSNLGEELIDFIKRYGIRLRRAK